MIQPCSNTDHCSWDGDKRVPPKEDEVGKTTACGKEMSLTLTDCGTKSRNQTKSETQTKSVHIKRIKTSTEQSPTQSEVQVTASKMAAIDTHII